MTATPGDEHAERFTLLRPLLFTIAYEILGSATESDDVLQDSYLRWQNAPVEEVRSPKSYLTAVVSRLALDSLKEVPKRTADAARRFWSQRTWSEFAALPALSQVLLKLHQWTPDARRSS